MTSRGVRFAALLTWAVFVPTSSRASSADLPAPLSRLGHRRRLEATDLVVFARVRATTPLRLVLALR
jgi:hypothetical protein